MRNKDINYSIIKFGDYCDMMIQEFEKIVKIEIITPDIKPDSGKFMGQDTQFFYFFLFMFFKILFLIEFYFKYVFYYLFIKFFVYYL